MQLNAAQKEAVEYLDGPLLVLAGPGTGKTQLLSQKVAYILQHTDTNPENILCLTFTETGAKNMRERLKTIIGKDAMKVNIGTYHAFGAEILAQYKNYAPEYDRKLNSAIDEVTQFKIVQTIQDKLDGTDILRGDNVKDIISVISAAKAADLTAVDLAKIAEQNLADSKVLSEAISPLLLNVVPRVFKESYEKAYRPIYEILKDYEKNAPIVKGIERSIVGLSRDLGEAIAQAEETQKVAPLTAWRDKYFEKDAVGNYRLKDRVANLKLKSVAGVMERYEKYLCENGLYDFDDMIHEAIRVLESDQGFKLSLEERYQFIMLDEFQDTNPAQLKIVKSLTDYEKPLIMAVGDDDQAIYEFQGASATNLRTFQEYYDAKVVKLTENYRSTAEILEFAHEVIKAAPDRFEDKKLHANLPKPAKTNIHRLEFISSDAEYGFVADKIDELIASGVSQSKIAVISYKTKYFEPLLPFLKAHENIKIAYEKRDNLLEDARMHEILTTVRYVEEQAEGKATTVSELEILSYDWFNVPAIEVIKAVGVARKAKKDIFTTLAESENEEIKTAMEFLSELVTDVLKEPLDVVLHKMVAKMPVDKMNESERFYFYENLAALKAKLRAHYGDKALRVADLNAMVKDYEAAEMPMNVVSPYRDAEEAVQVLSAHKAKGLEFDYVFLISVDHMSWGKGKGNNNLLALPKNLLNIRHTGTTDSEKLRILYVALTRARVGLYVTNARTDFNNKSPERLEYLEEYEEGDEVMSPFIPSGRVELMYLAESGKKREENVKNWLMIYAEKDPDVALIYKERAENLRFSASALTTFVDIVYAGPMNFFKTYILQAPREPETEAMARGDLIHKTFDKITKGEITEETAAEFYLSELNKKEFSSSVMKELREKGTSGLLVALKEFGEILKTGLSEVDFATEKIVVNGVPVTGKIDHLAVDEKAKAIEIYDFKTGNYHKEKWQSHATLYKYMLQLEFYRMLVKNSVKYRNYKVEKAHILFVTPNNDGEVFDKVYEYTEKGAAEFLKILGAVYEEVKSLDFMNDAEIFVAANEKLGIHDIKQFIELLLEKNNKK